MRIFLILSLICTNVFSQIPTRFISNSGFEQPSLGCTSCYNLLNQSVVNGWSTTDPTGVIELWASGFQGKASHSGTQFAEINANNSSFLYQELCLAPNEVISYSIWYLQRGGCGVTEQMRAQLTTTTNVVVSQSPIYTANNTWVNYTGTLTNNNIGGIKRIGFVSTSSGSCGNLIDDITISLRPIASLLSFTPSSQNEGVPTKLNVLVNGRLLSQATIIITLTGTAVYPNDFNIGTPTRGILTNITPSSITLTLPAGDYDPNLSSGTSAGYISIPFTTITDGIPESLETIICTIDFISGGGGGNPSLDLSNIINGNGANCSTYVPSVSDTIKSFSPLPITLKNFTAKYLDGKVLLAWSTSTEKDNDFFTIYKSSDGLNYYELGKINGSGNSNLPRDYKLLDIEPKDGFNYYKLTQTDYDGTFQTLSVVVVKVNLKSFNITQKYNILGQEIK